MANFTQSQQPQMQNQQMQGQQPQQNAKPEGNQTVFVSGIIHYSSVGSIIDGERLERLNANRRFSMGPHTSITIDNPKLITPNRQQVTPTEAWVRGHFYKSNKNNVMQYQAVSNVYNKATYQLPWIAVKDAKSNKAKQYHLSKHEELSAGQTAILVLRTFISKKYSRVGLTLEGIVVVSPDVDHPDVQNYGGSRISSELRDLGLVLTNPEPAEPNDIPDATIDPSQLPDGMNLDNVQNNNQSASAPQNNYQQPQNNGYQQQADQNQMQNNGQPQNDNPFDPQMQSNDNYSFDNQSNSGQSINNDPTPDLSNAGDIQNYFNNSSDFNDNGNLPQ